MKNLFWSSVSAVLLGSAVSSWADPSLYAVTSNGDLGSLDPLTGQLSLIGAQGVLNGDNIGGLALSLNGNLYGLGYNGGGYSQLYQISTTTGAATYIGTGNAVGSGYGMAMSPNGTLYAFLAPGGADSLYTINPTTGADTLVGAMGGPTLYGNLTVTAAGGLYINPGYGTEQLYRVDLTTGVATLIGNTGTGNSYAIGSAGNTVYMAGLDGTISSLNLSTGAGTTVSTYNNAYGYINALGSTDVASPAPAPEPSTWALGGLGIATLMFLRRK